MLCNQKVPKVQWFIQGHTFASEAKVLPLKCHDLIMGEDCLEDCGQMWIDYKLKTVIFTHKGKVIVLQVVDDNTICILVSSTKLKGLLKHGTTYHCVHIC